jgi:hypothetical protein
MFIDFAALTAQGMPLVLLVIALVEWIKKMGVTGESAINGIAVVIGLLLGVGYQLSVAVPADFAGWFSAVIFGLILGLSSIGLYKSGESIVSSKGV